MIISIDVGTIAALVAGAVIRHWLTPLPALPAPKPQQRKVVTLRSNKPAVRDVTTVTLYRNKPSQRKTAVELKAEMEAQLNSISAQYAPAAYRLMEEIDQAREALRGDKYGGYTEVVINAC